MDAEQFKKYGHQLIDWAIQYMATLSQKNPTPKEKPKFMRKIVPEEAPEKPEPFEDILNDLEPVACHGMAHWQHPQFFAYFPSGNSWPSILGDLFSNATGANGSTWHSCPVVTELEVIVMDWCCKFLGLPNFFLSSYSDPMSEGQGLLQCSASEAIFYTMIWARQNALKKLKVKYPNKSKAILLNMLVAYCNNECHCCVERAAIMGCIRIRKLKADNIGVIRSHTLRTAITEDLKNGLVPFYHCAIIGSTGVTSSDDLMEVGPLCKKYGMWLHVDAAYAGSAFVLPELSHLKQGYEYVWSTNINTNKWMMCNFDATLHWVRYRSMAVDAFAGSSSILPKYPNNLGPDLKHYGMASSRRMRAFKLWCVIRTYGVEGIRRYIRNHINLAKLFEMYVRRDSRFEISGGPFRYGLVAFRLKGYNTLTSQLLDALNSSHKIHMVSSHFHNQVVIRFALCYEHATEQDVDKAWRTIDEFASIILLKYEREHREDLVMQYVYNRQHEHDDDLEEEYTTNPRFIKRRSEIEEIVNGLQEQEGYSNDPTILGAEAAGVDGSYDHGDTNLFRKYDENLRLHPEAFFEEDFEESTLPQSHSMLHLTTLNAVIANSPDVNWSLRRLTTSENTA